MRSRRLALAAALAVVALACAGGGESEGGLRTQEPGGGAVDVEPMAPAQPQEGQIPTELST